MKMRLETQSSKGRPAIRRAGPEDQSSICALFELVYRQPKSEAQYRWLYEDNPAGANLTWLAQEQDTGRLIGARTVFPWRMRIDGREVLASQSGDAMVRPDWRRRGVYSALVQESSSGLAREGIPFSYSFPNGDMLALLSKVTSPGEGLVGTHVVGNLCRWVRPVCWETLASSRLGSPRLSRPLGRLARSASDLLTRPRTQKGRGALTVRPMERFEDGHDEWLSKASRPLPVASLRDSSFLNWRYIDTPRRSHTVVALERGEDLLGYAALELIPAGEGLLRGRIHDLLAAPETGAFDSLMDGVLGWFGEARAMHVAFSVLEGHPYEKRLRRWGFFKRPTRQAFVVTIYEPAPWNEALLDKRNWFLTLGDRDVESGD